MAIKKEIDNATITVELEYSNTKIRQDRPFQQNPGPYLINECDVKSKQMRKELQNQEIENIMQVAETTPIHDRYIVNKSIKMLIRDIDIKICKKSYAESKIPEYSEWLDLEERNVFHEGVGLGTLKCITRFNHYGY